MTLPNFLIIGAQRSGTTSLHNYLEQHPQIYMSPVKEPRFFAFFEEEPHFHGSRDLQASVDRYQTLCNQSITNINDYCALFRGVTNQKAIGEVSPIYLYSPRAPERIKKTIPDVKLIAILRDPAERAYSSYFLNLRQNANPVDDFIHAIQEEEIDVENIWSGHRHKIRRGFYYAQVKRYFSTFSRNQIKVYLYDDLQKDPIGLLQDIFRFLNVDEAFIPDVSKKLNTSASKIGKNNPQPFFYKWGNSKNLLKRFLPEKIIQKIKTSLPFKKNFVKPKLPTKVRKQLIQIYREDITKLQNFIQRDLTKWLE